MEQTIDWSGPRDLSGKRLTTELSSYTIYTEVNFTDCILDDVTCHHSLFRHCNFTRSSFVRSQLMNCIFDEVRLDSTTFARADLSFSTWRGNFARASYARAPSFESACLFSALMCQSRFPSGSSFVSANLNEVEASHSSFEGANFSHASLDGANFYEANLRRTIFNRARLLDANLTLADLAGARFDRTQGYESPYRFLRRFFEFDARGIIVYTSDRLLGIRFDFRPGLVLRAQCNRDPRLNQGSGLSFGPLEMVKKSHSTIYQARIIYPQLVEVVIPYQTYWPRTSQLTLIRVVEGSES